MKNALIILFAFAMSGGTVTIVLGYQMFKKYKLDYLSSYFLYLVFFIAFGFFGYIVQAVAWEIIKGQAPPSPTLNILTLFLDLAAGPLMIVSFYFFILFSWKLLGKKLAKTFTIIYFSFYSIFMAFIITLFFGIIKNRPTFPVGSAVGLLTIYIALLPVFARLKELKNKDLRNTVKVITIMHLTLFSIYFGISFFLKYHYVIAFSYFALHFIINLPPLFYLKNKVVNLHSKQMSQFRDGNQLERILVEHGISKREQEIVHLILQGKSNPEIEDELYISIHTVKNHVSKVYQKFGVKNRLQFTNLLRTLMRN